MSETANPEPTLHDRLRAAAIVTINQNPDVSVDALAEQIATDLIKNLVPTNTILVSMEITAGHEEEMDTPTAFEPGYDYVAIYTAKALALDLDEEVTELITSEGADIDDLFPDGLGTLAHEIAEKAPRA